MLPWSDMKELMLKLQRIALVILTSLVILQCKILVRDKVLGPDKPYQMMSLKILN